MSIDKTWHLSNSEEEMKLTEFELQLWRVYFGFLRWQQLCEVAANKEELSADELSILHVIRMRDQPKAIADIGMLLNRMDYFNINYTINKLIKRGFIQKENPNSKQKQKKYITTEKGKLCTDEYSKVRRSIIKEFSDDLSKINFQQMTEGLNKMKGIYDEATRVVSSYYKAEEES
jgi:predicted MarR family transcription regulator